MATVTPTGRPSPTRRLIRAARVLGTFDLAAVMIAAQIDNRRQASRILAAMVKHGHARIATPAPRLVERLWTVRP